MPIDHLAPEGSGEAYVEYGFDFDSTLVTVESLDVIADIAAPEAKAEIERITYLGMCNGMPFDESLALRLKLIPNLNKGHIETATQIIRDEHISPSAIRNSGWFSENAGRSSVISGGFTEMIIPSIERLGLDPARVYANQFEYDERGNVIGFNRNRLTAQPRNGKTLLVGKLAVNGKFIMVGDGSTDAEVRTSGVADEFWTITEAPGACKEKIINLADRVASNFDDFVETVEEYETAA